MERGDLFDEVAKMALEQAKKRIKDDELNLNQMDEVRKLVEIAALASDKAEI